MPRVVLVETQHADVHRHHRAEYFPFLQGLARHHGAQSAWWVYSVPPAHMHVGERYVVDLAPAQRERLARDLAAFGADVVVFHDRPAEALRETVLAARPGVRLVDLTRLGTRHGDESVADTPHTVLLDCLGIASTEQPLPLLDVALPDFERTYVEGAPARRLPARLALPPQCVYRRPVVGNPAYAGLETPSVREHLGCAFCPQDHRREARLTTSPVELAIRQIVAHQAATEESPPHEYLFEDTPLSPRLTELFEAVLARRLRASTFYTMIRVDVLLGMRALLEELLPRLRDGGHALRVLSIGAENLSDAENLRFNKGITQGQIWSCHAMIEDFQARFPGTFACPDFGFFSAILFTPWTTPADLLINVEGARRLGRMWLNRVIGTRLQLWEGMPITDLARRDGLVAERAGASVGDIEAICRSSPDQREIPWRFADPRTARLHSILIRLPPAPNQVRFREDDPLLARVRALCSRLPREIREDYVGLVSALVQAGERVGVEEGVEGDVEAVFREAFGERLQDAPVVDPEPPPPPPDPLRSGELRFAVRDHAAAGAEYLFHVAPHHPGRGAYRRVGPLVLFYKHEAMTPGAEYFASILCAAMRAAGADSTRPRDLPRWRSGVARLLQRAGVAERYELTLTWSPDQH